MSDEPETLEETQARLSQVPNRTTPVEPTEAPPSDPPTADLPLHPKRHPRRGALLLVVLAAALVAGLGAGVAILSSNAAAANWSEYPGTAYRDADDALNGDSLETVMANGTGAIEQFQRELTEQFGMDWTTIYDETLDHDYNYYGGTSMLYFWDTGMLQGRATVSDPDARQKIVDAFAAAASDAGADEFSLWNDLLKPGDPFTLEQYGLGEKQQQAHWSGNSHDNRNGVVFSLDVVDRTVPVGETFTGGDLFYIDEGDPATIYVIVFVSAPGLLAEADRAEFIERLKPYEGLTKPEPSN